MDIVKRLIAEKQKRKKFFEDYTYYAKEIKKIARKYFSDAKVYVFGSVVDGSYHVMLSDIDVAVVTSNFDKRKALELKVEVEEEIKRCFSAARFKRKGVEVLLKFR